MNEIIRQIQGGKAHKDTGLFYYDDEFVLRMLVEILQGHFNNIVPYEGIVP
jgi:hypothetical protein